jgi:hypothetical protein
MKINSAFDLARVLGSVVETTEKTASMFIKDDHPETNLELQNILGDPDDQVVTPFTQFSPNPGGNLMANPMSPHGGDDTFWAYMIPGAKFQAHDGSQWIILDYTFEGAVELQNVWYPRLCPIVSVQDVRRSIAAWIEPVQVIVRPAPAGVDYGSLATTVKKDR